MGLVLAKSHCELAFSSEGSYLTFNSFYFLFASKIVFLTWCTFLTRKTRLIRLIFGFSSSISLSLFLFSLFLFSLFPLFLFYLITIIGLLLKSIKQTGKLILKEDEYWFLFERTNLSGLRLPRKSSLSKFQTFQKFKHLNLCNYKEAVLLWKKRKKSRNC